MNPDRNCLHINKKQLSLALRAWGRGDERFVPSFVGSKIVKESDDEIVKEYLIKNPDTTGYEISENDDINGVIIEAKEKAKLGKSILINVKIGKTDFRKGSISV